MGWLRARLGESNTAVGVGILYMIAHNAFPQYAALIDGVAAAIGVGHVVTPKS